MGLIELTLILTLAAEVHQIPSPVLRAVCQVESDLRPDVVNANDGGHENHSIGLCQVSVGTAKMMGSLSGKELRRCQKLDTRCVLFDPAFNASLAARYLKQQLDRYGGDEKKALSAYNAGSYTSSNRGYVSKVYKLLGKTI